MIKHCVLELEIKPAVMCVTCYISARWRLTTNKAKIVAYTDSERCHAIFSLFDFYDVRTFLIDLLWKQILYWTLDIVLTRDGGGGYQNAEMAIG